MEIGDKISVLIETDAENLDNDIISIVDSLIDSDTRLVYVSINKPYLTVRDIFRRNGVKTENIFFIDCISASLGKEYIAEGVSLVQNISDLNSISIEVSKAIEKIHGKRVLLVDAIHTLWIYQKPEIIARFIQNLTEKTFRANTNTIIFIVDEKDKRLIRKIVPFFDKVVRKWISRNINS